MSELLSLQYSLWKATVRYRYYAVGIRRGATVVSTLELHPWEWAVGHVSAPHTYRDTRWGP